jgi:hypothetical protein
MEADMPPCYIDHIIVTAPTLEAGAAFVRRVLGVSMQTGGQHPRMGTHNLLMRLGDELFLEVIAANPAAPAPGRPRWFALDALRPDAAPALRAWVVRTSEIAATTARACEALGKIEPMSRGALNWLITITADGFHPLDGLAPALIEWQTQRHPAAGLPDQGLSLVTFEIVHPQPGRVSRLIASIGLDPGRVALKVSEGPEPQLIAHIKTPQGLRLLSLPR